MARGAALAGSLLVHGAVASAIALAVARAPADLPDEAAAVEAEALAIEVVRAVPPPAPRGAPAAQATPPAGAAPAAPADPAARSAPRRARADASRAVEAPGATVRIEASDAGGGEAGEGGGVRGAGIGFGTGGGIERSTAVAGLAVPVPVVPRVSRARPPKLIYPTRDREADDSEVFVARLTIDRDGLVVGARLVRGFGGVRDDEAENAVWRLRFRPALDDDGNPIKVTIEQPFLVE